MTRGQGLRRRSGFGRFGPFGRRRRGADAGALRTATSDDLRHLREFARGHDGVEAFLEPRTTVTETTVLLVAASGEWTRRRVAGPDAASSFARKLSIPLYDVGLVGYPERMREWNRRVSGTQT